MRMPFEAPSVQVWAPLQDKVLRNRMVGNWIRKPAGVRGPGIRLTIYSLGIIFQLCVTEIANWRSREASGISSDNSGFDVKKAGCKEGGQRYTLDSYIQGYGGCIEIRGISESYSFVQSH
jgi:hypothetical protein